MRDEYDFSAGERRAIIPAPTATTRIAIHLDDEVLDWFRAQVDAGSGGDYQTLIKTALWAHIQRSESL